MSSTTASAARATTCGRCKVTSRWMPGHERRGHPPGWAKEGRDLYCLVCRRERAAEARIAKAPKDSTAEDRADMRKQALIEFEIRRDPDRTNGEIAKAARCTAVAVVKARERLEDAKKA